MTNDNILFSQWLDELRALATQRGYVGDIVADVGVYEWAKYYCDGNGCAVDEALNEYLLEQAVGFAIGCYAKIDAQVDLCGCKHAWDEQEQAAGRCQCGKPDPF